MRHPGFSSRIRAAARTPMRSAVCIGTAIAATAARRTLPSSSGSTARSHVSGWNPAAPAAGSWRFFLYKGSFIPSGLQPGAQPEAGRFFAEGGAWSRVATGNVGLCGPQLTVDGPPPPCTEPPKK